LNSTQNTLLDLLGLVPATKSKNFLGKHCQNEDVFKSVCVGVILNSTSGDISHFRVLQILLNLARSIFEEQNNLQCLVTKIMTEARDLLKCERCAVFLLDTECCEAVSDCLTD
jgi:hypothetical protein